MAVEFARRLLSVEEYHKMGEVGILKEQGLELINGEIVKMSPVGSDHASIVEKLKDFLTVGLFQKAIVRVQNPVHLSDFSESEPDLAIVNYREDYYQAAHPKPADILVLIEVAVSSVEYDEEVKLPLYAQSQVQEYWLVKVDKQQIEVHTVPAGNNYKLRKIYKRQDEITVSGFDLKIALDQIFSTP